VICHGGTIRRLLAARDPESIVGRTVPNGVLIEVMDGPGER
jgi:hypothetical protein